MEQSWCRACHTDVALAHAVADLPCPVCGSKDYFCVSDDGRRDSLLGQAERMMRLGRWGDAAALNQECYALGLMTAADYNLSSTNLEWRRDCARAAREMVRSSDMNVSVSELREWLEHEYDAHVVSWLLREYRGLRIIIADGKRVVEVADD